MEPLIKHVLDTLAGLGDSEQVALYSLQEDKRNVIVSGGFSNGHFILPGKHLEIEGTPLESVIATCQAATFHGVVVEGLPFPSYEDQQSGFECFCMPLLKDAHQVMGVAVLSQPIGENRPDFRTHILTMLRTLVASAMENARLFQLATVDGLTGLYVRRYFEIRLQEEIARIRRHGGVLSVLLLDVDHFKRINDNYGHQQGDKVLEEVARLLQRSTRHEIDIPCRYGGEEFIILLPNTDVEGAYVLAERIRKRCEQLVLSAGRENLKITISAGIAAMSQSMEMTKEELIRRADLMLYAAKQAGRNQIMKYNRQS